MRKDANLIVGDIYLPCHRPHINWYKKFGDIMKPSCTKYHTIFSYIYIYAYVCGF